MIKGSLGAIFLIRRDDDQLQGIHGRFFQILVGNKKVIVELLRSLESSDNS